MCLPWPPRELEKLEDYGTMGLALLGKPAEFAAAAGGDKGFGEGTGHGWRGGDVCASWSAGSAAS